MQYIINHGKGDTTSGAGGFVQPKSGAQGSMAEILPRALELSGGDIETVHLALKKKRTNA